MLAAVLSVAAVVWAEEPARPATMPAAGVLLREHRPSAGEHPATAASAAATTSAPADAGDEAIEAGSDRPPLAVRRIVKGFDFDEKRFGNYSNQPLNWQQHVDIGFPQYLEGTFDLQAGHTAAPSFRLDLDGGSLAFDYLGRDIAVKPNCDYLVVIWCRTDGLQTARAYATTYFLDRKGVAIEGTERRSRLVGGQNQPTAWQPLVLQMPCDQADARYLGLTLWLDQDKVWNTAPRRVRTIERENVKGTAWFDDVVVYRMPRVSLAAGQSGGVFGQQEPVELLVELSDPDGLNLAGHLVIRDADGRTVHDRSITAQTSAARGPQRVVLPDLPIGWYGAEFVVTTEGATLLRQSVDFVRVGERLGLAGTKNHGFGVVLRDIDPAVLDGQRRLLSELGPKWIKLPVWYAQQALLHQLANGEAVDAYLQTIREVQGDPVGILRDDPSFADPHANANLMAMLDLFKEPPLAWKHLIAGVWSRYAGLIQVWQIGADDQATGFAEDTTLGLVSRIRKEMSEVMTEPALATTRSIRLPPSEADPADYRSVFLPASVSPQDIADHLQAHLGRDPSRLWVTVDPLARGVYPRELRLADLGRRLIETYFANVGAVFVEAPWEVRVRALGPWIDPREDYLILRTVSNVLGGARPVSRTTLDGCVECIVFDHRGSAALCVWDEHAPPAGRQHQLELGGGLQQVDLWGRRQFLPAAGRKQTAVIGSTPTFLLNCPTWLIEFRRQFTVRPAVLEANFEKVEIEVGFRNTHSEPISGVVRLLLPEEWDVRPNRLAFALAPGAELREKVALHFPPNAQAQIMPLVGEFAIDAERRFEFTTPAWFEFGIEGLDMGACAYRSRNQVTVRLSMTNRTDQTLHFEAYLVAPNRQRMERQFSNFQPGQSLTRSFVVPDAADLAGRNVRISLREIQGSRFWNRIVAIP